MSDPLKPTFIDRLRDSRALILWMLPPGTLLATAFYFIGQAHEVEPTEEFATVISFGQQPFEDGPKPLMNVQLAGGQTQSIFIGDHVIRNCRRGDTVLLHRRGLNLRVAPEGCSVPEKSN